MSCRSGTPAEAAEYEGNVRATFARLKRGDAPEHDALMLEGGGSLLPLAGVHLRDARLVESLARWRAAAAFAFPVEAAITPEGVKRWLQMGVLDAADRMLWLVTAGDGRTVGHLGFANAEGADRSLELDDVVRGEPATPGLMSDAVRTLTGWAQRELRPATLCLRVFADNEHAVRFYSRLGWRETRRTPLRRMEDGAGVTYERAADDVRPDRELLRMELKPPAR